LGKLEEESCRKFRAIRQKANNTHNPRQRLQYHGRDKSATQDDSTGLFTRNQLQVVAVERERSGLGHKSDLDMSDSYLKIVHHPFGTWLQSFACR
jgi:hypothetical protein